MQLNPSLDKWSNKKSYPNIPNRDKYATLFCSLYNYVGQWMHIVREERRGNPELHLVRAFVASLLEISYCHSGVEVGTFIDGYAI
jgi:hypothetical protein